MQKRGDTARFEGGYREIIQGMNDTIENATQAAQLKLMLSKFKIKNENAQRPEYPVQEVIEVNDITEPVEYSYKRAVQ